MMNCEEYFMIRDLKSRGLSIKQISNEVCVDRKTVSKWLSIKAIPTYKRNKKQNSKLDPYKNYILHRMNEGCVNSMVLFDEIVAKDYEGKHTILREFMKPYRE